MMQWHFWATGKLREGQPVSTHPDYISREKLFKMLRRCYNYDQKKWTMIKEIILPFSRARARIVNSNDYFLLKSRQDWRERFIDYLEAPNHEYPMEVID